jgi:hypothetical protein
MFLSFILNFGKQMCAHTHTHKTHESCANINQLTDIQQINKTRIVYNTADRENCTDVRQTKKHSDSSGSLLLGSENSERKQRSGGKKGYRRKCLKY